MMKRLARRFGWGRVFGILLLIALVGLRVWDPAALKLLRLKTFDIYQIAKPRVAKARPVVIVDIDEASLNTLGQWPWPRTVVAKLIEGIAKGGAAAIGLDIVFAEPDRTSPRLIADMHPNLSAAARQELRGAPDHDAVLADIIRRTKTVLGQSAFNPRAGDTRAPPKPKASFATLGDDPDPFLIKYPGLLGNIPELEDAARGRGMFTVLPDPDGLVRRVPIVMLAGGVRMPSLNADMLRLATGQTTYVIKTGKAGVQSVVIAGVEIPTDANAQLWIYFTPHDPKRFVSAADVLNGKLEPRTFAGKLVLIGSSATGLFDAKPTPVEPVMPGVELHAQALENILSRSSLKRPAYAVGAELLLALAVGIAFIILVPILGAFPVAALGFAITALVSGLAWYLFAQSSILLDVVYPLIGGFAVFITMVFVNYIREEAQRQQIRGAFGQYLSPDLVNQLANDPDKLVLGGETREMTILFSDVRGFTTISESYKSDPQGLTVLINRLLTPLSNVIMERRGTIDKYMGDNVMAFWNAPLDDPDHAINACASALDMLVALQQLNVEREREAKEDGKPFLPLEVGIGINTGEVVVGNMGSEARFDYTVLGDTVNLAARLEGQSKTYGMTTIIGDSTVAKIGDSFATIELDAIRVKGKNEPEIIHAILGPADGPQSAHYGDAQAAVTKMLAAYRKQDWKGAAKAIKNLRGFNAAFEVGGLCDLYEDRIAEFRRNPPPKDWDGVFTATTK